MRSTIVARAILAAMLLSVTGCQSVSSAWNKVTFNAFSKKSKATPALTNAPAGPEVPQTGGIMYGSPQASLGTPTTTNHVAPAAEAVAPSNYTPIPATPVTTTTYPAYGPPHQAVTPAANYQSANERGGATAASYPSTGYTAAQDYSVGGNYPMSANTASATATNAQQWGAPQVLPKTDYYWPVTPQAQASSYPAPNYAVPNYATSPYPATTTPAAPNPNVSYFQQVAPPAPQTGYDTRPPVRTASSSTGLGGTY